MLFSVFCVPAYIVLLLTLSATGLPFALPDILKSELSVRLRKTTNGTFPHAWILNKEWFRINICLVPGIGFEPMIFLGENEVS